MEWKDVAATVGRAAPLLGLLLGGPAGAVVTAAGAMVSSVLGVGNSPADVAAALTLPDSVVKLRELEARRQIELESLTVQSELARLAAETSAMQAVNATMQAEASASHWPTYSWRPFIGFCVGVNTLAASLLVLAVFVPMMFGNASATAAIAQLPTVLGALAAISGVAMPVLGIASWFRGKAQADPRIPTDNRG